MLMDSRKLYFQNPNGQGVVEHKTPQELLVELEKAKNRTSSLLGETKKEI